jgi:hypothetical protein
VAHFLGSRRIVHVTRTRPDSLEIISFPKDAEAIRDAHYLGRDIRRAEAAVLKLEKRTKL